jgi:4-hydroxyphenylpyruvate dioxygenase
VCHAVKNGDVIFAFYSPLTNQGAFAEDHKYHLSKHGDAIKDIALAVENCEQTYKVAVSRGSVSVQEPTKLEDEHGHVIIASVRTYGDTIHTFIERANFKGYFLPGFIAVNKEDKINEVFGKVNFGFIDHIVGNHPIGDMEPTVQWYEKMLDFHRFWSIDDSVIHTEYR